MVLLILCMRIYIYIYAHMYICIYTHSMYSSGIRVPQLEIRELNKERQTQL